MVWRIILTLTFCAFLDRAMHRLGASADGRGGGERLTLCQRRAPEPILRAARRHIDEFYRILPGAALFRFLAPGPKYRLVKLERIV